MSKTVVPKFLMRLPSIFFLLGVSFLNVFAQSAAGDKQVLDQILQRAKQTHSDSVLIIRDGKPRRCSKREWVKLTAITLMAISDNF